MVGAPHCLSMTTFRPRGPSVTLTAFARALTPRSRLRRAESSNSRVLAIVRGPYWSRCGPRLVLGVVLARRQTPRPFGVEPAGRGGVVVLGAGSLRPGGPAAGALLRSEGQPT